MYKQESTVDGVRNSVARFGYPIVLTGIGLASHKNWIASCRNGIASLINEFATHSNGIVPVGNAIASATRCFRMMQCSFEDY